MTPNRRSSWRVWLARSALSVARNGAELSLMPRSAMSFPIRERQTRYTKLYFGQFPSLSPERHPRAAAAALPSQSGRGHEAPLSNPDAACSCAPSSGWNSSKTVWFLARRNSQAGAATDLFRLIRVNYLPFHYIDLSLEAMGRRATFACIPLPRRRRRPLPRAPLLKSHESKHPHGVHMRCSEAYDFRCNST